MNIRSRLNLSILVSVSITLIISVLIVAELFRVTDVVQNNLRLNALTKQVLLLQSLTYDYTDDPLERKEIQWYRTYATLERLLKELQRSRSNPAGIPANVIDNYANIKGTFDHLVTETHLLEQTNQNASIPPNKLQARLSSLLLTRNQTLHEWALGAVAAANASLLSRMQRDCALFVALLAALALTVGTILYMVHHGLLQSITRLRLGVDTITRGNLNHRIPLASRDEFGELSDAFNTMTAELQVLYEKLETKHRDLLNSEQRFRALVEQATDCVLIARADASITYASPSVENVLGYAPEDLLKHDLFAFVHPGDLASSRAAFGRLVDTPGPIAMTVRVRHRNGNSRLIEGVVRNLLTMPAVAGMVMNFRDITERKQAEEALRSSEEKFSQAFQHSPMVMTITALADGAFLDVNDQFVAVTGFSREEALGKTSVELGWISASDRQRLLELIRQQGRVDNLELNFSIRDGRKIQCLYSGEVITLNGQPQLFSIVQDITARKQMEEQLRQTQKMEAIGELAGGVAHDFNNILTAMIMNLNLLPEATLSPEVQESIKELENQARRAAALTRQLLLFSRRSVFEAKVLDLNEVVENLLKMLRRLIGEHIRLLFDRADGLPPVEADPGMIEQVLMNLVVNARDAMPKGGQITIRTEAVQFGEKPVEDHPQARPGQFLCLSVADTGCGMDEATLKRIFEPFFTTKEVGKGTGLGLATVYGIVAQHKGWVEVGSEVGKGATFKVFFPTTTKGTMEPAQTGKLAAIGGHETILLVEDEASVRRAVAQGLRRQGYRVFEAGNGREALTLWREHAGQIGLLFSDMVMPEGMSGLDLVEKLKTEKPGMKVILSSGYNAEMAGHSRPTSGGIVYLQKPYQIEVLSKTVRDCLDRA